MSAIPEDFITKTARLSDEVTRPFPNSSKIYVQGSRPDLRVPMRQVEQADTPASFGAEQNPPVTVYDTSGPYTDPEATIDLMKGLASVRSPWIEARADTELLDGPSSAFGRERQSAPELAQLRFEHIRQPRRALPGANVTQMHYARQGIITPEMEYVAIRENLRLDELKDAGLRVQHRGVSFGASIPERVTPEFVRD
ncbi:MAG: phosphomethylpyrimidine synthase ThiC, partial [Gammaproteobacteria bacterium]|nr:phosphomethylpyrimidine synthase ThiC [Gammaproteobacteria bacterium]